MVAAAGAVAGKPTARRELSIKATVIIPTYNRPEQLAECLRALSAQDHPSFEVIVVDDGSAVPASSVVASFSDRLHVTCFRQTNAGPAAARNAGAARARGAVLAFTDDDCRPRPSWLSSLCAAIANAPDALAGGDTVNGLTDNVYAESSQDLVTFLYSRALSGRHGFEFFTSNNMACSKDRFLSLQGFDTSFPLAAGEDREFGLKWQAAGGRLIFVSEARVEHRHALTLTGFWRQQRNYGRGAHHLRHRLRMRGHQPVPFAGTRFYLQMAAFPFRQKRRRPIARSILLAVSQIALAVGFLADRVELMARDSAT
jgi:GT2 family glycosyltransferase